MSSNVDLVKLFSTVAETLVENQASLNKADEYNQDHGDHMVDIFQMITGAVKEAPKNDLASGLATASKLLTENQAARQKCIPRAWPRRRSISRTGPGYQQHYAPDSDHAGRRGSYRVQGRRRLAGFPGGIPGRRGWPRPGRYPQRGRIFYAVETRRRFQPGSRHRRSDLQQQNGRNPSPGPVQQTGCRCAFADPDEQPGSIRP